MTRLAVSNIAWPAADEATALALLAERGVAGVEVAPTRIAAWDELTPAAVRRYAAAVAQAGLVVASLQAICYGRPDCLLLGEEAAFARLAEHLRRVAGIGAALGAAVAVFGAPANRRRGACPAAAASALTAARMARLGDIAGAAGIVIAIEPVPAAYGGDFLVDAAEVDAFVARLGHPRVRLHLDTGCAWLGGDDIAAAIATGGDRLAHFHAAEPQLAGFAAPAAAHAAAAAALAATGYQGWVAIEMRAADPTPLAALATAIDTVRGIYCGDGAQVPGLPPTLMRKAAVSPK